MIVNVLKTKSDRRKTVFYLSTLLIFTGFLRLLTLQMIPTGGDDLHYFDCAWTLVHAPQTYVLDHQSARWGIVFPLAIARLFLGPSPYVFFLVPFLVAFGQAFFVFKIGERLHSPLAGFLAGFLLTLFPGMIDFASTNIPEIYQPFYLSVSLFLLIKSRETGAAKRTLYVVLGSAAFFLGYLSKVTAVYFFPSFAVFLFAFAVSGRKWKDPLLFTATFGLLVVVETLLYRWIWGEPFGIVSVILRTHLDAGNMKDMTKLSSFPALLGRFGPGVFRWYWWPLSAGFLLSIVYLVRRKLFRNYAFLMWGVFSFLFFHTFGVKSMHPVVPFEPFNTRYFLVMASFSILFCSIALADWLKTKNSTQIDRPRTWILASVLIGVGFLTVFDLPFLPEKWRERGAGLTHISDYPLVELGRYVGLAKEAKNQNLPVVGYASDPDVDDPDDVDMSQKAASAFQSLFLRPYGYQTAPYVQVSEVGKQDCFLVVGSAIPASGASRLLWVQSDPLRLQIVSRSVLDENRSSNQNGE